VLAAQRPTIWRKSVKHHMLSSYYSSLFAVLSSQLHERTRHDGGLQGLLELLRAVPMMRVVMKEHAERQGISLAERLGLRALGGSARRTTVSATSALTSVSNLEPGSARSGAGADQVPHSAHGEAAAQAPEAAALSGEACHACEVQPAALGMGAYTEDAEHEAIQIESLLHASTVRMPHNAQPSAPAPARSVDSDQSEIVAVATGCSQQPQEAL
jgi:hypothetical protein